MIVILTATFFAIMIAWFLSQTGMQVYAATLDNNSKTWSENSEIDTDVIIDGGIASASSSCVSDLDFRNSCSFSLNSIFAPIGFLYLVRI